MFNIESKITICIVIITLFSLPTLVYGQCLEKHQNNFLDFLPTIEEIHEIINIRRSVFSYRLNTGRMTVGELCKEAYKYCPKVLSEETLNLYVVMLDSPVYTTREHYTIKLILEGVNNRQRIKFHYIPLYKNISREVYYRLKFVLQQIEYNIVDDKIAIILDVLMSRYETHIKKKNFSHCYKIKLAIFHLVNYYELGNNLEVSMFYPYRAKRAVRVVCPTSMAVWKITTETYGAERKASDYFKSR
jgi:hypothetical protein